MLEKVVRDVQVRVASPDAGLSTRGRLMRWTTMLAHVAWAAAVTISCVIEPAVPLGLAAIGALLVAWMTERSE